MAYSWRNLYSREEDIGDHQGRVPLVTIGLGERIRRSILYAYLDLRFTQSGYVDNWLRYGCVSMLELTTGTPPPPPEWPADGGWNTRDILYSEFNTLGPSELFDYAFRVPPLPSVFHVDTDVSRGGGDEPHTLWWVWGTPDNIALNGPAYYRMWARVLIEQV